MFFIGWGQNWTNTFNYFLHSRLSTFHRALRTSSIYFILLAAWLGEMECGEPLHLIEISCRKGRVPKMDGLWRAVQGIGFDKPHPKNLSTASNHSDQLWFCSVVKLVSYPLVGLSMPINKLWNKTLFACNLHPIAPTIPKSRGLHGCFKTCHNLSPTPRITSRQQKVFLEPNSQRIETL